MKLEAKQRLFATSKIESLCKLLDLNFHQGKRVEINGAPALMFHGVAPKAHSSNSEAARKEAFGTELENKLKEKGPSYNVTSDRGQPIAFFQAPDFDSTVYWYIKTGDLALLLSE